MRDCILAIGYEYIALITLFLQHLWKMSDCQNIFILHKTEPTPITQTH